MVALLAVLASTAMLATPGAARANVTVGSSLNTAGNDFGIDCGSANGDCVLTLNRTLTSASRSSPVNGTVVRWGVRVAPGAPFVRLRTVTRTGQFGPSGVIHPFPSAGLNEFTESVPIAEGSRVGVDDPAPGFVLVQTGVSRSFLYDSYIPGPDGSSLTGGASESGVELLLNAEIQPTNTFTVQLLNQREPVLQVTWPNPGTFTVEAVPGLNGKGNKRLVLPLTETSRGFGGTSSLRPTLTPAARRVAKARGRAKGILAVTFTPTFGTPSSQQVPFTLRKRHKHKK
jgi:hypothetical protein